jgi:hypothetical protein
MVVGPVPAALSLRRAWRSPGGLLAGLAGVYLAVNAVWALAAPAAFAARFGLPLASGSDDGWVLIYALRTTLLVAVLAALLLHGQLRILSAILAVAVIVPLADALLVWDAGASTATVLRQAGVAVYLSVTAVLLRRGPARPH